MATPTATQAATDNGSQAEGILLNVVSLASARLAAATQLAQWKWQNKQPVLDPQQDAADSEWIGGLAKEAPHFGLTSDYAVAFLNDQTKANNEVQATLFDEWRHGTPPSPIDEAALQNARSSLYQLSDAMLAALVQAQSLSQQTECPIWLSHAETRWKTQMTTLTPAESSGLKVALQHVCADGVGSTA